MVNIILILSLSFITGCVLRGGVSTHPQVNDTYFRGGSTIGTVSLTQDIKDTNLEVYVQHKSLLFENEETNCFNTEINCVKGGAGLNEVGINVKFNLY